MFELIVRVVLASGTMAAAGILGRPDFDLSWKCALLFASYSYLLYGLEQKGGRNAGIAGLAAVADCAVAAVLLASAGLLESLGFLSALPMVYAFFRFRSNAAMMSPLVASWLLVGANLFGGGNAFTSQLLYQALGVLVVGVVLSQVRTVRENKKAVAPSAKEESPLHALMQSEPVSVAGETVELNAVEYREFRESYKQLADSARELEKRSRRDRACVQLFESAVRQTRAPFAALASRIHDLCGAEGVVVYSLSQDGKSLVVRGTAGNVEQEILDSSIEIGGATTDDSATQRILESIALLREPGTKGKFAAVLLKVKNKVTGALALFSSNSIELEASLRRANESADFLSELTHDLVVRDDDRRRMREAELLYTVATTTLGATTKSQLAARVVRDLAEATRMEHVSAWTASGEPLAHEGVEHRFFEEISYPTGKGTAGWLAEGAPVVEIANARTDSRTPSREAVTRRIGAMTIVPLEFGAEPFGFLVASTSKPNGIGLGETETIRAVAAELSHAIARVNSQGRGPEGLTAPKEFFENMKSGRRGHLIYLEVVHKEELSETYGKPAVEHAIRRFAVRLRADLPIGAFMTRRNEGDYVVFIPDTEEAFVQRWANDATTLASLIGVHTPDGRTRIPLGLRAKVSPLGPAITPDLQVAGGL